jgi:Arc/MetJ family transcription regulator
MPVTTTSIRLDTTLADEAKKLLGAKSRTEAVRVALREIVAMRRFKVLMKNNSGKFSFAGLGKQSQL